MKRIAKAIVAFLLSAGTALGTWVGTLADGPITSREWVTLGIAVGGIILTTFGVYQVKNDVQP